METKRSEDDITVTQTEKRPALLRRWHHRRWRAFAYVPAYPSSFPQLPHRPLRRFEEWGFGCRARGRALVTGFAGEEEDIKEI